MELDGLKQNLEEAERIELLNEELQEQLTATKFDATSKEQLVCNILPRTTFITYCFNLPEPTVVMR